MKSKDLNRRTRRGFTLIEMMVTAVVIGVLATLSAPGFQRAYDKAKFRAGERVITSGLKKARGFAISNKNGFGVHVNGDTRIVTVFENKNNPDIASFENGDSVFAADTLPDEFRYVYLAADNNCIVFQPNGSARVGLTGYGNVFLIGETGNMMAFFVVNVLASTGRVSTYSHFYNW